MAALPGVTLPTLAAVCAQLRIAPLGGPAKGARFLKKDYIAALGDYYLREKGLSSESLLKMRELDSPMLAAPLSRAKEESRESLWTDRDWFCEEKIDGVRVMLFFGFDDRPALYGRGVSPSDYLPMDYTDKIHLPSRGLLNAWGREEGGIILDSEVASVYPGLCGDGSSSMLWGLSELLSGDSENSLKRQEKYDYPLQFNVFDVVYSGGWILEKPLFSRRRVLLSAIRRLKERGVRVRIPASSRADKFGFYRRILKEGGEGVILKNLHSPYINKESRAHRRWLKAKRPPFLGEVSALCSAVDDTVEGWVSGYRLSEKGEVAALEVSVSLNRDGEVSPHIVAVASGLPSDVRESLTSRQGGTPHLKPEFYGKVVEVSGEGVKKGTLRLIRARLLRFREDKSPSDCGVDSGWLLRFAV